MYYKNYKFFKFKAIICHIPFVHLLLWLQGKLAATDTDLIHQQHELVLNAIREKAAYASQNLYSAAEKADHSIRWARV